MTRTNLTLTKELWRLLRQLPPISFHFISQHGTFWPTAPLALAVVHHLVACQAERRPRQEGPAGSLLHPPTRPSQGFTVESLASNALHSMACFAPSSLLKHKVQRQPAQRRILRSARSCTATSIPGGCLMSLQRLRHCCLRSCHTC